MIYIITQHVRDRELMEGLVEYMGCGKYSKRKDAGDFKVLSIVDINNKIKPFFTKYPLLGVKALNFADFKSAAEIMKMIRLF